MHSRQYAVWAAFQTDTFLDIKYMSQITSHTGCLTACTAFCRAVESEDASETEALLSAAEQGQAGPGKFFYFSTFVQAALIVHELRLLDIASVRQVDFSIHKFASKLSAMWAPTANCECCNVRACLSVQVSTTLWRCPELGTLLEATC